jgi:hypothetical protein
MSYIPFQGFAPEAVIIPEPLANPAAGMDSGQQHNP